jgi:hypothetical protein
MDSRFSLPAIDCHDGRPCKTFRTVLASDGLQRAVPYWHLYFCSISAKLESILDGNLTVAKMVFRFGRSSNGINPLGRTMLRHWRRRC